MPNNCLHDFQENIDGKYRCSQCFKEETIVPIRLTHEQKETAKMMIDGDHSLYDIMQYLNECMFNNR